MNVVKVNEKTEQFFSDRILLYSTFGGEMLAEHIKTFSADNHHGVLTTFRKSKAAQMSIVTCGPVTTGVGFSSTLDKAKIANLLRDNSCTLLISSPDWRNYIVLEGHAKIFSPGMSDPEELRLSLREIYKSASGKEHPNWEEFDRVMVSDKRVAIIVEPKHHYGTI